MNTINKIIWFLILIAIIVNFGYWGGLFLTVDDIIGKFLTYFSLISLAIVFSLIGIEIKRS